MNIRFFITFSAACLVYLLALAGYQEHRYNIQQTWKNELPSTASTELTSMQADLATLVSSSTLDENEIDRLLRSVLSAEDHQLPPTFDPVIFTTIDGYNDSLTEREVQELAALIEEKANRYNVDPLLLTALVSQESAFHADAVSPVGAIGYGQLMPGTARDLGVDPYDAEDNLDGAARYLSWQLRRWATHRDGVERALASYNAGPGAVAKYDGIPPYPETQNYVKRITAHYAGMRHLAAQGANWGV